MKRRSFFIYLVGILGWKTKVAALPVRPPRSLSKWVHRMGPAEAYPQHPLELDPLAEQRIYPGIGEYWVFYTKRSDPELDVKASVREPFMKRVLNRKEP